MVVWKGGGGSICVDAINTHISSITYLSGPTSNGVNICWTYHYHIYWY